MQSGIHAANTIKRRLHGKEAAPFTYRDLGSMATISRFHAVVSFKRLRLSGFLGWLMWLFVHITFLTGFKNRLAAMFHWTGTFAAGRPRRAHHHACVRAVGRVALEQGGRRHRRGPTLGSATMRRRARVGRGVTRGDRRAWSSVALAVDPRAWARSQMAFTLASTSSSPAGGGVVGDDADRQLLGLAPERPGRDAARPALVEVHGGHVRRRRRDRDRPLLRVRAAVAGVHGSLGAAFGVPFAFEGIFFFPEAVFTTIYIFGWKRLSRWAHFWTGVPDRGLRASSAAVSVVAANAWMNSPQGVTLDSSGKVTDVDPLGVIFNHAMP